MKQYATYCGVCLLWLLCSLGGYAQNRCWNDKRIPKEWFVTALGGYTFGYGQANFYWGRDIKDYVPPQRFEPYYVHNAKGWGLTAGAGIYFNKSIGMQVTCNYLFGHHYKVNASYSSEYSRDVWSKFYDSYQAFSNGNYYVRTCTISPALLYRYQLSKFSVYALLGLSIAFIKEYENTTSVEQIFYRGSLMEEHRYVNNSQAWKKNVLIAGISCGLGMAYPIRSKIELIAQAIMKTQKMYGFFEKYADRGPYSLDGIELSMGIKYNFFGTNLNMQ